MPVVRMTSGTLLCRLLVIIFIFLCVVCLNSFPSDSVSAQACPNNWTVSLKNIKPSYKPGETIAGTATYSAGNPSDTPGAIQQIMVGMVNQSGEVLYVTCIYNGTPKTCPAHTTGTGSFSWQSPSSPGTYQILAANDYRYSCEDAKRNFRPNPSNRLLMTIQVSDTAVPSNSSQITLPIGFDFGFMQNFQNWIDQVKSTLVPAITETKTQTSTATPTPPSTPTPAPSSPPWNPITTITSWLQQNQQTILTIIAFILIAIAGLIFILDRFRGEMGKAISILLGAIAAGYLAWVYVIYPVFVWLTQNWIAVTIIIAALIAIVIVAWKKGWIGKPISPDNGGGYVPPETSAEDTPFDQFEEFIYGKNGYEFEEYIRKLFSDMNYKGVNVTPQSKDGGVDVRAYKIDESETRIDYIIQCKRWEKNSVGRPKLQEFWGIMTDKPPHPKGIFICTRGFSKDAEEYAKLKGITYWNMERLFEFHQKYYR